MCCSSIAAQSHSTSLAHWPCIVLFRTSDVGEEVGIVADIIFFVEGFGGQDEAYGSGGEVVEGAPGVCLHEQSLVGVIEQEGFPFCSVVERDMKAAAHGDNQFSTAFVGMSAAAFPSRDVVHPVDPPNVEGHLFLCLRNGEVAAGIENAREVDQEHFLLGVKGSVGVKGSEDECSFRSEGVKGSEDECLAVYCSFYISVLNFSEASLGASGRSEMFRRLPWVPAAVLKCSESFPGCQQPF